MIAAVTGATGFVGRALLAELASQGVDAIPLVRKPSGLTSEIVTGSLERSTLSPDQLNGAEVVIHLASRVPVANETQSEAEGGFYTENVLGTELLLAAALKSKIQRFVFVSSIKAMGERSVEGSPLDADDPPHPEDAYGRSKLAAEDLVRSRCEAAGIAWTVIRPPMVYGSGSRGNFAALTALVRSGIPLPFGLVRNRRSIIYVGNLAAAIVHACRAPGAANQVLLIADSHLSTPGLIRAIAAGLDRPARLLPIPTGLLRPLATLVGKTALADRLLGSLEIDAAPSLARLGWAPPVPLASAMAQSLK